MTKISYVVAFGNAFDGLILWGPFDRVEDALGWAESSSSDDWTIVPVTYRKRDESVR